jgi:hypothetical protein
MARKFKIVEAVTEDGWTDWVFPTPRKPYHMKCCGCGLVHDLEFQAAKVKRTRNGWTTILDILDWQSYGVIFRARRNERLSDKKDAA